LLYGAFATIPLFFIWIYWVWFITLLGAEISYALSVHHQRREGPALGGFLHALLWLEQLWLKQKEGISMSLNELIDTSNQPFVIDSEEMINTLKRLNLIHTDDHGLFLLSRDLNDISVYSLSQQLPYPLPQANSVTDSTSTVLLSWRRVFEESDNQLKQSLSMSLAALFSAACRDHRPNLP
jgi:membrane protein